MGRKRYVTSDISKDGDLSEVAEENPVVGLMWPWFITALDDWGRMEADPREIRNETFGSFKSHYGKEVVDQAVALYVKYGLVHRYENDGKAYLQFNPKAFYKIQTYIDKKRQKHDGSKLPPPSDHPWGTYWSTSDWGEGGRKANLDDD